MTLHEFRTWEVGEVEPSADALHDAPVNCSQLTTPEMLVLRRFRAGLTIGALARRAGVSRYWVQQVESGEANPQRLVEFWSGSEDVG